MSKTGLLLILLLSLVTQGVEAQQKGINFQAVIKRPDGSSPTASGLTVTAQILDPVNNCILREEEHSGVNISNGYLNLVIGSSSASTPAGRNPSPLLSIQEVMNNSKARTNLKCVDTTNAIVASNQTYHPNSHHARKLRIRLNILGDEVVADFNMRAVAFAVNSETLNGKTDADLLNINSAQGITQNNVESIFSRFTKLDEILNNFNSSGNSLNANITGNAATATNVSGVVSVANGGTGATDPIAARTNLGLGPLATMTPTGTADNSTYLRGDGTWAAVSAGGSGAETDPTVQDFAKNTVGTGLSVSGSNQLMVNYGTTAGTSVQGNDSRVVGAFQSSTTLTGGDLSGSLPAPTVSRINGVNISTAVISDDQKYLKYVHGSGWQPQFVKLSELKNLSGTASAFNTVGCTSAQTLTWSSITDQFACQNISLPVAKVTGLAAVATSGSYNDLSNKPALGLLAAKSTIAPEDIADGAVTAAKLGSDIGAWTTNGADVYRSSGKVGIGTTSPTANLDVSSSTFLGSTLAESVMLQATSASSASLGAIDASFYQQGSGVLSGSNFAVRGKVQANGNTGAQTGTTTAVWGLVNPSASTAPFPSFNKVIGLQSQFDLSFNNGTTMTDARGVDVALESGNAGNQIATWTGIRVNTPTGSGTITNKYALTVEAGAGNVGIGTTSPTAKLEINGTSGSTLKIVDGNQAIGKVLTSDANGQARWQAAITHTAINSSPYNVTSDQTGMYLTYNKAGPGKIYLPTLSGLSNGWQITIARQVPYSLTLYPDGVDKFDNGLILLEMQGQNIKSITLTKLGSNWTITSKTDDCIVGQSCWSTNNIYIGIFNGQQYFTTPGNCVAGSPYTCNGGMDTVTYAWANGSGTSASNVTTAASSYIDGKTQTATLATTYTDADAAKFCNNMNVTGGYAGYTDWYLPSRQELAFLYQQSQSISGFAYSGAYWSSTDVATTTAWSSNGSPKASLKTIPYNVRCVRRF